MRIIFGSDGWKLERDTYDVPIQLDDAAPVTANLFGNGKALIGQIPPALSAGFMMAGKIGFHFNQTDFTIPVRDLSAVVARLELCVAGQRPENKAK